MLAEHAPRGPRPAGLLSLAASLISLMTVSGAVLDAATVCTFDGTTLAGPTLGLAADAVEIGGKRIALIDCDWIEPGGTAPSGPSAPSTQEQRRRMGVWLADGGWLPVARLGEAVAADGKSSPADALLATGPLGELVLPLGAVLGWGMELPPAGDGKSDQVVLASGPLQGRVLGIAGGKLRFESPLNPQPLELPLAEVVGMRLAVPARPPRGVVLSVSLDPARPPLVLLPAPNLPLAAAPGVALADAAGAAAPTSLLANARLRVEGGRRVYLGSLKPARVEESGAFDIVWHWRSDSDLDGGPLMLGGTRYAHGISVHSKAILAWELGGGYTRLRALVGIADLVAPEGNCSAALVGDGKVLWSRDSVKGTDKPQPIDLDVQGVRTLELRVDFGARYDIGDHLTLADAWVLSVGGLRPPKNGLRPAP